MANCRILKLACCLWFVSTGCLAVVNVNSSVQVPENQTLLLICQPLPYLQLPAQLVMPWPKTRIPARPMAMVV